MKIYKYLFLIVFFLPFNVNAEDLSLFAKIDGINYIIENGILYKDRSELISVDKIFVNRFSKLSYGVKNNKIFILKSFSDADASYKDLYLIENRKLNKVKNKHSYIKFQEFVWKDCNGNVYSQKCKVAYDLYLSYKNKHLETKKSCIDLHKDEDVLGAYGFDYLIFNFSDDEINYIIGNCDKKISIKNFCNTF
jgi:hypothetical protein